MTPFTAGLTGALVHSLWQDTVIAAILLAMLARLRAPRARYGAACAALAAMLVVPVITGFGNAPSGAPLPSAMLATTARALGATSPAAAAAVSQNGGARRSSIVSQVQAWALPLWCAGVIAFSLRLIGSGAHTITIRRRSVLADEAFRTLATTVAARMGIDRPLAILVSTSGSGPATVGWLRPAIVVPAVMMGLPADQLTAILAHELAHVRRHDVLVNLFQLLVETLCFYHPAVWWVSHRIRLEREVCCDDEVVATCGDAIGYARALTFVARHAVTAHPPAVGAAGGALLYRVRRLLGVRDQPSRPSSWTLALAAALIVAGAIADPRWIHAQAAGPASSTAALLTGTLYDPLGEPAAQILLTLSRSRGPVDSMQTRTDERGAFRFTGVAPGTYRLTTPVTDFIAPDVVEVSASNAPLEARLAMDETAVNIRVCRDCRDSWFKLPALAIGVPGDGPSASALARAEPAEGWDAFNQRPLSYPAGLKTLKVEGTVALEGVIRPDGTTGDLQVASSPSAQLTAAAVALVQSQRWRPARVRTTPVQVPLHATVEFTLNGN